MASHARPPHCDRRQEEGEDQCHSQLRLKPALTSEWQHDKLSVAQSVYVSLFLSLPISGPSPSYVCFSVFLPIRVYLTCPPIHVVFAFINVTHSQHFFSVSLSLSVFFCFLTPMAKSIVTHSSQSLNVIYCNTIISHSLGISLSTGQTTYSLQYQR